MEIEKIISKVKEENNFLKIIFSIMMSLEKNPDKNGIPIREKLEIDNKVIEIGEE
jgi:hypothetical protein